MITLNKISKKHGKTFAVSAVNFCVPSGAIFSIVGPSGSGKSTLLRIIAGVETPDSGSIVFDRDKMPAGMSDVVMVWQSLALFPHLNVRENVEFGLRVRGVNGSMRTDIVSRLLTSIGLEGFESRTISGLSGGELKRVALARALAVRPRVLLLDEPFSGLDQHLRGDIMSLVRKIHSESGLTIIFVTHDHVEAISMSSHLAVLKSGRIEQWGEMGEVLTKPQTGFVARFLGKRNVFEGRIADIESDRIRVDVAGTTLWGVIPTWFGSSQFKLGGEVYYVVERRKVAASAEKQNCIRGEVHELIFDGSLLSIRVKSHALQSCSADVMSDGKTCAVGSTVSLSWDAADAFLIPKPDK